MMSGCVAEQAVVVLQSQDLVDVLFRRREKCKKGRFRKRAALLFRT